MSEIDRVKEAANPFAQLKTAINKLIDKNETQIILLDRLCELKEDQQKREIKKEEDDKVWRDVWAAGKRKETRMAMAVLVIAGVALYLDYFRGWPVIKWLTNLIG